LANAKSRHDRYAVRDAGLLSTDYLRLASSFTRLPITVLLSPLFFRQSSIRESRKKRSRDEGGKTGIGVSLSVSLDSRYDMMDGGNKDRIRIEEMNRMKIPYSLHYLLVE
jgi:hypothetical protein